MAAVTAGEDDEDDVQPTQTEVHEEAPQSSATHDSVVEQGDLSAGSSSSDEQLKQGLLAFLVPVTSTIDAHVHSVQESQAVLSQQIDSLLAG